MLGSKGWWGSGGVVGSRGGGSLGVEGVEGGWGLRGRSGWVRSPGVVGSRVVGV